MLVFFCEMSVACDSSWQPKLDFDIEGYGFMVSMAFISGHSYSLTTSNKVLLDKGKKNYFCGNLVVSSEELIEILNEDLRGEVTSEQVSEAIKQGLMARYPCE